MWKPSDHGLFLTVTMGGETRPGTPGACQNFLGPVGSTGAKRSLKAGDYILSGMPLNHNNVYHVTDDIKDHQRVLVLRVSKKA